MDQAKIGRFIAERRKAQGLTQRQLADALSISDKTVFPKVKDTIYPNPRLHDFNLVTEY